jgi:hypothetical protein
MDSFPFFSAAAAAAAAAGYDHEEGSSDEEQDDIFELEGMTHDLDISDAATASALQQQMHEQQLAALQVRA